MTYERLSSESSLIVEKRKELGKEKELIKEVITKSGLEEALLKDKKYTNVDAFIVDFLFNDHINRQMLTDLLQGPMAKRIIVNKGNGNFKIDKPNVIKRATGIDSGKQWVGQTLKVIMQRI